MADYPTVPLLVVYRVYSLLDELVHNYPCQLTSQLYNGPRRDVSSGYPLTYYLHTKRKASVRYLEYY